VDRNAVEAQRELAAVLASRAFRASPKLSSLLGYLFSNGKPGSLTQAVIAVEFFGRNASQYDRARTPWCAQRSAACALKLAEHYTNEGSTAAGRLEIPKGAYEVVWRQTPASGAPNSTALRRRFGGFVI